MGSGAGPRPFVIAVDAGGTHTRVGCFDRTGELLGRSLGRSGSPAHNHHASEHVSRTVVSALARAGLRAEDALALAAGVAGVSRVGSNQGSGHNAWTEEFVAVPGLTCPRLVVNDAVVAHRGALAGEAGVIAVAGTGSMILAITEDGEEIESGQFQHYAGGARHLVFEVLEQILTARPFPATDPLAAAVLQHWEARDLHELRRQLLDTAGVDRNELKRRYGALAPTVTGLADVSPVADAAIRSLTRKTAQGIRLLAPMIRCEVIPVALAGALATDQAFSARLADDLRDDASTRLTEPVLDPLGGAALIAYHCAQVPVDDHVLDRLALRRPAHR